MTQKTEFCNIKHNLASNAKLIKKCVFVELLLLSEMFKIVYDILHLHVKNSHSVYFKWDFLHFYSIKELCVRVV